MSHTIGVDIGTFESKGVLVDSAGRVVAEARRPHEMIVPRPGWAEHRAEEDWWDDFVAIVRELLATGGVHASEVAAVAVSAIGPCMLPVDATGRPLMNAVLYGVDGRAAAEVEDLTDRIGTATLLERCGAALTSQSVGPKILWLKRHRPAVFARTARVLTSTSYLVWKLTGAAVIDHYTAANFAPLYDVNRLDWTTDLADDLVDPERLPRLLWSTEIAGHVTEAAAAETGLVPGTPVTAGTIDAAAEAVSVGVAAPGDTMLMYGSTVFVIAISEERVGDARLWYAPWLFPGLHASMAGLATSGTLTHWFRDQLARDLRGPDAFARLADEAAVSPPGAKGLVLLPYFSGERTPIHDPFARGILFGLDLTHTRGDIYRALIEGIALGTRHVFETYAGAGITPRRLRAVGGGTRNRLWVQATSDATGIDQEVCAVTTGAAYGDAFLAALAVGLAAPADIARWNPVAEIVRAGDQSIYDARFATFRALYEATKGLLPRG